MNAKTDLPHLSTTKEVADALRVTTRTVTTLVARNEIPSVKIMGSRRFDLEEVIQSIKDSHAKNIVLKEA